MNILGIGTDICNSKRIQSLLKEIINLKIKYLQLKK